MLCHLPLPLLLLLRLLLPPLMLVLLLLLLLMRRFLVMECDQYTLEVIQAWTNIFISAFEGDDIKKSPARHNNHSEFL